VELLTRLALIIVYPLLMGARLLAWVSGRDPLRLKEPAGSCWIARPPAPPPRSYFSESGVRESRSLGYRVLIRIGRGFAPPADLDDRRSARPAALPSDIPDEVYTLW
jgi:hypothetical protein